MYGCSEFIRVPKPLISSITSTIHRSLSTSTSTQRCFIQSQSSQILSRSSALPIKRSLHMERQSNDTSSNNPNHFNFSDIHTWIHQHSHTNNNTTTTATATTNTNPNNTTNTAAIQQYLQNTKSTYTHLLDLKYRLNRKIQDIEIDILIDYNPQSTGRYSVLISNLREKMIFTCIPVFHKNQLIHTGIQGIVRIDDLRSGEKHEIQASDINEKNFIEFFNAIGMDMNFIKFVSLHQEEIINDLYYNSNSLYENLEFIQHPFRY